MFALLKYIFFLALFLVTSIISGFYGYFAFTADTNYFSDNHLMALAFLAAIPVSLVGLFGPLFSVREEGRWLSKFIRFILVILMLAFLGYQLYDARPSTSLFSSRDLAFNHPEAGSASFLLASLFNEELGAIPDASSWTGVDFYKNIESYRGRIEDVWQNIAPQRLIIDQLADLSILVHPYRSPDKIAPDYGRLADLARIYQAYALLEAQSGKGEEGVTQLGRLEQVARHGLAGSTYLEEKMLWAKIIKVTIKCAYQIVINEQVPRRGIASFVEAFTPLTFEETSFQRTWIGEYLQADDRLSLSPIRIIDERFGPELAGRPVLVQLTPPWLFSFFYRLTFQKNRTSGILRAFWAPVIETSKKQLVSPGKANLFAQRYARSPEPRNLSGWYFHRLPYLLNSEREVAALQGTSELFGAFLASRVGSTNIKAYFTDQRNKLTVNGKKITNAGQDGKLGTDDDFSLEPLY